MFVRVPGAASVVLLSLSLLAAAQSPLRADAERLTADAASLLAQAATAQRGLDVLQEALTLWRKAGDRAGEGTPLFVPRLPFTRQEADLILAVRPNGSNLKAVDFAASRETVTSGRLAPFRYVHFATHGYVDAERPAFSSLVLATVDENGQPRDGFLRATDIYNLTLPAEVVVLSACQTGVGRDIKGEGLVGLTRAFMYAASAALRAAQIEMVRSSRWDSPYHWAAFTMQGEWR